MKGNKRVTALLLTFMMVFSLLPMTAFAAEDPLALSDVPAGTLEIKLDGEDLSVDYYTATYVANPIPANRGSGAFITDYQKMYIYVSEKATEDSPIIFMVNNSGWMPSALGHKITDGKEYVSDSDRDAIGAALDAGYVIVNMGTRSRGLMDEEGNYVGHSPAVVTDAKAGIRYLRYNSELGLLPAGDTDRIIITGTSGGGGLSAAVAASGNSADYYPSLYEIGAAGVVYDSNEDSYFSTINDDVFATVAYCPITDFDHADQAYEWTYNATRERLGTYSDEMMDASQELKDAYPVYVDSLGLKLEDGKTALTEENLEAAIIALLEKEIEEAFIERGGKDALIADIKSNKYDDDSWLSLDEEGNAAIDYGEFLFFVANNQALKTAPAFSNFGTPHQAMMNEDNLFGALITQEYSPFEFWSWNNHSAELEDIGKNNTGLDWDEYLASENGEILKQQMKMVNPISYLIDDYDGDSAPYWYVRHGVKDRDTSFAVEAILYYAMINDESINDVNFEFAWLQGHGGDYDVQEAYEWISEILDDYMLEAIKDVEDSMPKSGAKVISNFNVPIEAHGVEIEYSSSHPDTVEIQDGGTVIVTRPSSNSKDIMVTITVTISVDKLANDGNNYGALVESRTFNFLVPARSSGASGSTGSEPALPEPEPEVEPGEEISDWQNPFTDVNVSDWFFAAVRFVNQNNMMSGTGATIFAPSSPTTRGMIVTILYRLEGEPEVSGNPFTDVAQEQWYSNAVVWASMNGIVQGYGNELFGPDDLITREQMALILANYVDFKGYDVSDESDLSAFADKDMISIWAVDALSWATGQGLIIGMGDGILAPQGGAERSQVAIIFMRFIENVSY